jgi:hypothetical protein
MQFRQQGNRIQVLAYRGYDREKSRASVKLVGSFSLSGGDLSIGLVEALNEQERAELQSRLDFVRQNHDREMHGIYAKVIAQHMATVAAALSRPEFDELVTREYADSVYASMDALAKALRRRKLKRIPKSSETS